MAVTSKIPTGRRNPNEVMKDWSIGDLDVLHDDIGLGREWQLSDRRRELYEFEQRELDKLLDIIERVPIERWFEPLRTYYGPSPNRTFYTGHDENPTTRKETL